MATLPDPATMTDQEILREWECVEDCDYGSARTNALVAELEKRQIDF